MAVDLQNPRTGSDATFVELGSKVALDVALLESSFNISQTMGGVGSEDIIANLNYSGANIPISGVDNDFVLSLMPSGNSLFWRFTAGSINGRIIYPYTSLYANLGSNQTLYVYPESGTTIGSVDILYGVKIL